MPVVTASPSTPVPPRHVTPEEMLLTDDGKLYELVDGQLREKEMSDHAQFVANRLSRVLGQWCESSGAEVLVESTFQCFPHAPELVRRPDVSFIAGSRLAAYRWGHGHFTIAPDVAVEIVWPRYKVYDLDRKNRDYFQGGVRRVWVINPEQQTLRIHRGPGDVSELVGGAELSDPEVLPGFGCRLSAIFARPGAPAA